MLGKPMAEPIEELRTWLAKGHRADGRLVALALRAIERIRGPKSELAEEWDEEDGEEWRGVVRELESRLRGIGGGAQG
jgi:Domain of unknown function (DUF4259)